MSPTLSRHIALALALALALVGGNSPSALAWWDRCNCQPSAVYPVPPAYIYDHTAGPSWSANGWSYPPVAVYYPVTIAPAPYVAAPYRAEYFAPPPGPPGIGVPARGNVQPLK
ncbi:MAG TPA: hypothetical protein VFI48_04375 [Hyphomicrobiaceae bacterium]|nr:hypothetical protein [Hyphomicrobiaceae bacterium]